MNIVAGILLILHGLVHLFYAGQSRRMFDLRPDFVWPDGSWAFTRVLGEQRTRGTAAVWCVVATAALALAGIAVLAQASWAAPLLVGACVVSALVFVTMWNGKPQRLADQGWLGVAIDVGVVVTVLTAPGLLGLD